MLRDFKQVTVGINCTQWPGLYPSVPAHGAIFPRYEFAVEDVYIAFASVLVPQEPLMLQMAGSGTQRSVLGLP